jgi:hypothetical protein
MVRLAPNFSNVFAAFKGAPLKTPEAQVQTAVVEFARTYGPRDWQYGEHTQLNVESDPRPHAVAKLKFVTPPRVITSDGDFYVEQIDTTRVCLTCCVVNRIMRGGGFVEVFNRSHCTPLKAVNSSKMWQNSMNIVGAKRVTGCPVLDAVAATAGAGAGTDSEGEGEGEGGGDGGGM